MKQIKSLFISICVSGILLFVPVLVFGQGPIEPSYEVSLQMLLGANDDGAKTNLPTNLSTVSQQIMRRYPYSNYKIAGTILTRMSSTSNFDYKSSSNLVGVSFVEIAIRELKTATVEGGRTGFQLQSFRFGMRLPFTSGTRKDDFGKEQAIVNYEQMGLTLVKIGVQENIPTLIGSLQMPGIPNDTVFLILTIKPVDL